MNGLNSLFIQWLKEWWMENATSSNPSSQKLGYIYKKAYDSLSKYSNPLSCPQEALQVAYIGKGIVDKLEKKLNEYKTSHPLDFELILTSQNVNNQSPVNTNTNQRAKDKANDKNKKPKKTKVYNPAYRSGAFAILIALHRHERSLTKNEIIQFGQEYSDNSFTIPQTNAMYHYTAWNSMTLLLKKELVIKTGNPPKYCLSEEGDELANRLESHLNVNPMISIDSIVDLGNSSCIQNPNVGTNSYENVKHIENHDNFDILLILDNREIRNKSDRNYFQNELLKNQIKFECRSLELGDALWIARDPLSGNEFVLNHLVERKTMADLVASIKDGRYKEQKVYFILQHSKNEKVSTKEMWHSKHYLSC